MSDLLAGASKCRNAFNLLKSDFSKSDELTLSEAAPLKRRLWNLGLKGICS